MSKYTVADAVEALQAASTLFGGSYYISYTLFGQVIASRAYYSAVPWTADDVEDAIRHLLVAATSLGICHNVNFMRDAITQGYRDNCVAGCPRI